MTPKVDTRRYHGGEGGGRLLIQTMPKPTDSKHTDSKHAEK